MEALEHDWLRLLDWSDSWWFMPQKDREQTSYQDIESQWQVLWFVNPFLFGGYYPSASLGRCGDTQLRPTRNPTTRVLAVKGGWQHEKVVTSDSGWLNSDPSAVEYGGKWLIPWFSLGFQPSQNGGFYRNSQPSDLGSFWYVGNRTTQLNRHSLFIAGICCFK